MKKDVSARLTSKNDNYAYAYFETIVSESRETDTWYSCFDEFAALLHHQKPLVRNRALYLLAANVRWDEENKFDGVLPLYLSHISDEKPITARQCIKALAEIGETKQKYIPEIVSALRNADLSQYKDSMRPLIEKDILETLKKLTDLQPDR